MEIKDYLEEQTGDKLGFGMEFSFDELGTNSTSLAKRAGKVGFKTSLTEFFRAAKRKSYLENPIAPNQAD